MNLSRSEVAHDSFGSHQSRLGTSFPWLPSLRPFFRWGLESDDWWIRRGLVYWHSTFQVLKQRSVLSQSPFLNRFIQPVDVSYPIGRSHSGISLSDASTESWFGKKHDSDYPIGSGSLLLRFGMSYADRVWTIRIRVSTGQRWRLVRTSGSCFQTRSDRDGRSNNVKGCLLLTQLIYKRWKYRPAE